MVTKKNNLKKEDIVKNISANVGTSIFYTAKIVNDIIIILTDGLILKKKIKINNFGTFLLQNKNERLGRNPKNKNTFVISKRIIASFSASNYLKIKINNVREKY